MSTDTTLEIYSASLDDTARIAKQIAANIRGGETIELVSDLGGGKTAFTRLLATELKTADDVSSPTFTIQNIYKLSNGQLHHFDFYRLDDAGIVANELEESIEDPDVITVVEWGDIVHDVLPPERLTLTITTTGESSRHFMANAPGELAYLLKGVAGKS